MNPLTNVKNIIKLSQGELKANSKTSWHDQYRNSAWIFVGGLPYTLTEGDIICVFSQFGEPVNINLVRDKDTGKSKGFCFICYEDQRSTDLAVDNFNGVKILGRVIRVDHAENYKPPKHSKDEKALEMTRTIQNEQANSNMKEVKVKEEKLSSSDEMAQDKNIEKTKKKKITKKVKEEKNDSDSDGEPRRKKKKKKEDKSARRGKKKRKKKDADSDRKRTKKKKRSSSTDSTSSDSSTSDSSGQTPRRGGSSRGELASSRHHLHGHKNWRRRSRSRSESPERDRRRRK